MKVKENIHEASDVQHNKLRYTLSYSLGVFASQIDEKLTTKVSQTITRWPTASIKKNKKICEKSIYKNK